jgi:hypothetical protein
LSELAAIDKTSADNVRARRIVEELRAVRREIFNESLFDFDHIRAVLGLPPEEEVELTEDEEVFYFDRHYAQQAVLRLSQAVDRGSRLESIRLEVENESVKKLFNEAHEAYLFGFDVACITLCRALLEHSLKEKLPKVTGEFYSLGPLIERAAEQRLLDGPVLAAAETVRRTGDKAMHHLFQVKKTAQEVLDCTRIVLNELYGQCASPGAPVAE